MALNISIFYVPLPIFLIALILIIVAIIILTVLERRLHRQVIIKKEMEDTYYRRKLEEVKAQNKDPGNFLVALDDVAREFFDEKFQISGARYSDLIAKFQKEKNESAIKFCEMMQETLYSGEKLKQDKLDFLFNRMYQLVRENEKAQMQKQSEIQQIKQATQPMPQNEAASVAKQEPGQEIKMRPVMDVAKPAQQAQQKMQPVQKKVGFFQKIFGKKKEPEIIAAKPQDVNMNIVKYLVEGKNRGFDMHDLKERLLAGGFKDGDIEKAITYLAVVGKEKSMKETPRPVEKKVSEEEGKRIFAGFMQPKNQELEVIKQEVADRSKASETKPKKIESVPYKEEKIELAKKPKIFEGEEPKHYERIGSFDDLERVKAKIKNARKSLSDSGYGGAGLG